MNRHVLVVGAVLSGLGCAFFTSTTAAHAAPTVHLRSGTLEGSFEGSLEVFRGIPFAAPPVGELRWRAPQPARTWSGIRVALQFGPSCPQVAVTPTQLAPLQHFSEDCLYLNIWAPQRRGSTRYPVMVWLHGGGFISGSGSEAQFDGAKLAQRGVLVVTTNYRLGRLGFFAHPALEQEHPEEPHGNYGLLDQVAALQWVRDNIGAFGGDPQNVTLFGESAGGISIIALSVSPRARGLFSKAIIQSGGLRRPTRDLAADRTGLPSAQSAGIAWAESVGVRGTDLRVASALRALPVETVAPSAPSLTQVMAILKSSSPMIDGKLLPHDPDRAFRAGGADRVPMIIGSNSLESMVWSFGDSKLEAIRITSLKVDEILQALDDRQKELFLASFRTRDGRDDVQLAEAAAGEVFMGAGSIALARATAPAAPVYLYRFAAVPGPAHGVTHGSPHGTEIFYVFGTLDRFRYRPDLMTASDRALSEAMIEYWTSFARSGVPSGAANWPRFDPVRNELLLFGSGGPVVAPIPHLAAIDLLATSRPQ